MGQKIGFPIYQFYEFSMEAISQLYCGGHTCYHQVAVRVKQNSTNTATLFIPWASRGWCASPLGRRCQVPW